MLKEVTCRKAFHLDEVEGKGRSQDRPLLLSLSDRAHLYLAVEKVFICFLTECLERWKHVRTLVSTKTKNSFVFTKSETKLLDPWKIQKTPKQSRKSQATFRLRLIFFRQKSRNSRQN